MCAILWVAVGSVAGTVLLVVWALCRGAALADGALAATSPCPKEPWTPGRDPMPTFAEWKAREPR
jgi:hypothetical protein